MLVLFATALPERENPVPVPDRVEIHLITMGCGEHLHTGGGHAALMVAQMQGSSPIDTLVYNFGDADWDDPWLAWHFIRGDLIFFLNTSGDLWQTAQTYGTNQEREVYRQRLNLTDAQARQIAEKLDFLALPENRDKG